MAAIEFDVQHFFVGNDYAKLFTLPAGGTIGQHAHAFDHEASLLIGRVCVSVDGDAVVLQAPCSITIKAGKQHCIQAITDALWACLWANPDGVTDPEEFDEKVIA